MPARIQSGRQKRSLRPEAPSGSMDFSAEVLGRAVRDLRERKKGCGIWKNQKHRSTGRRDGETSIEDCGREGRAGWPRPDMTRVSRC